MKITLFRQQCSSQFAPTWIPSSWPWLLLISAYGPIVYKNESQREEIVYAIDDLVAKGGGDCPELAFTGILEALNAGPRFGSPMFVFTDANAKDATTDNINAVKVAAYSSGATINFFAKAESCAGSIRHFHDVASFTSGQVCLFHIFFKICYISISSSFLFIQAPYVCEL